MEAMAVKTLFRVVAQGSGHEEPLDRVPWRLISESLDAPSPEISRLVRAQPLRVLLDWNTLKEQAQAAACSMLHEQQHNNSNSGSPGESVESVSVADFAMWLANYRKNRLGSGIGALKPPPKRGSLLYGVGQGKTEARLTESLLVPRKKRGNKALIIHQEEREEQVLRAARAANKRLLESALSRCPTGRLPGLGTSKSEEILSKQHQLTAEQDRIEKKQHGNRVWQEWIKRKREAVLQDEKKVNDQATQADQDKARRKAEAEARFRKWKMQKDKELRRQRQQEQQRFQDKLSDHDRQLLFPSAKDVKEDALGVGEGSEQGRESQGSKTPSKPARTALKDRFRDADRRRLAPYFCKPGPREGREPASALLVATKAQAAFTPDPAKVNKKSCKKHAKKLAGKKSQTTAGSEKAFQKAALRRLISWCADPHQYQTFCHSLARGAGQANISAGNDMQTFSVSQHLFVQSIRSLAINLSQRQATLVFQAISERSQGGPSDAHGSPPTIDAATLFSVLDTLSTAIGKAGASSSVVESGSSCRNEQQQDEEQGKEKKKSNNKKKFTEHRKEERSKPTSLGKVLARPHRGAQDEAQVYVAKDLSCDDRARLVATAPPNLVAHVLNLRDPSATTLECLGAVCILIETEPTWKNARTQLKQWRRFSKAIKTASSATPALDEDTLKKLRELRKTWKRREDDQALPVFVMYLRDWVLSMLAKIAPIENKPI